MSSDQYKFAKWVSSLVVSYSVSSTVGDIVRNNAPQSTVIGTAKVKIATMVIGAVLGDKVWEETSIRIDRFARWATSAQMEAKKEKEEEERRKKEEAEKSAGNEAILGEVVSEETT
jgi:hypothetical protein